MVRESKLWKQLKKNTPQIQWTRLESWASFGVPDLLGYNDKCGFFMVELKVASGNKISFSPHQKLFHYTRTKRNFILVQIPSLKCIKLFKSSSLPGLLVDHRETPSLAIDDWDHIQRLLLESSSDAWSLLVSLWSSGPPARLCACSLARLSACSLSNSFRFLASSL